MTGLRFGSVCSGIEAASVAFGPLGWEPAWFAEVDVAASAVLAHRLGATAPQFAPEMPAMKRAAWDRAAKRIAWGDRITNWGDMTRLPALVRAGVAEAPEILCGGTPCQAFSVAGARGGLADPRGGPTLSFVELADAIDARRASIGRPPSTVLWENVPGVLSSKDNAFGCFLAALAGEDVPLEPPGGRWTNAGVVLGPARAIAWRTLDSQFFNLAQRRRRVYVVASAADGADPAELLLEFDGLRRDSAPSRDAGQAVAGTLDARASGGGFPGSDGAANGHVVPVGRSFGSAGLEIVSTFDASYAHTRGASGQDMRHGHSHLVPVAYGGNNQGGPIDVATARNAHGGPHGRLDFESEPFVVQSVALRGRDGGATAELGGEQAGTLRASEGGGDKPYVLAPIGFNARQDPDSWVDRVGPLDTDGNTQAIAFQDRGRRNELNVVAYRMAVRRLLPVECEALQGFPADWTLVPIGAKLAADGPRYKQIGNAWAVPCVRWIGERIARRGARAAR